MRKIFIVLLLAGLMIPLWGQNLTPKKVKKLWGLANENDSLIIEPKYTAIGTYTDQYTWVNIGGKCKFAENPIGGKWGVIDMKGREVCPVEYDYVDFLSDNLVAVNKGGVMDGKRKIVIGGKWGYYDLSTGKECVPVEYDFVGPFLNADVAWVYKGTKLYKKTGIEEGENAKGKVVLRRTFKLSAENTVNKTYNRYSEGGLWALVDKSGQLLTPFSFSAVGDFKYGYTYVKKDGKWGLIDSVGHITVPCQYASITSCYKEKVVWAWIKFEKNNSEIVLCSAIDGRRLSDNIYRQVYNFSDSVAWFVSNERFGLIHASGKELIKPTYKAVGAFYRGIAYVKNNDKLGYVNNRGKVIAETKYDLGPTYFGYASPFRYQGTRIVSWVKKGDKFYWIDQDGNIVQVTNQKTYSIYETIPNELWDY